MNVTKDSEYIYLLQEREFVRLSEPTYKIGRTSAGPFSRVKSYKGSRVIIILSVIDSKICEQNIISIFKTKYTLMKQYGYEYFNGDVCEMARDVVSICTRFGLTTTSTDDYIVIYKNGSKDDKYENRENTTGDNHNDDCSDDYVVYNIYNSYDYSTPIKKLKLYH